MNSIRFSSVAVALLAGMFAAGTADATMPGSRPSVSVPPSISVRPTVPQPRVDVPRGVKGGKGASGDADASDKGRTGGTPPGAGAASVSGIAAEITAQQAVVDSAYKAYQDVLDKRTAYSQDSPLTKAEDAYRKASAHLRDVKSEYEKMRKKYFDDPTAANDALVKAAEQLVIAAQKQADVTAAKVDEARQSTNAVLDQLWKIYMQKFAQFQKEQAKLDALKTKLAQAQAGNAHAIDVAVTLMLSP
jgi:hypothetical protein